MGKETNIAKTKASVNNTNNVEGNSRSANRGLFKVRYINDGSFSAISRADFDKLNRDVTAILRKAGVVISDDNWMSLSHDDLSIVSRKNISIDRYFNKDTGVMEHLMFYINDEKLRGKGVSKDIHKVFIPLYEKIGVKEIKVDATLNNGGYTWAQYGFRVSWDEASAYKRRVKSHKEDVARIIDVFYKDHPVTARFPMKLLSSQTWGKEVMSGTSWTGSLDLTNKEEKNDFYTYVGYKR